MSDVSFQTMLPVSCASAFAWHARNGALQRLLPPWQRIKISDVSPAPGATSLIQNGGRLTLKIAGVPWPWIAEHKNYQHDVSFTDTQIAGPFTAWTHRHDFTSVGDHCQLSDHISYEHSLATAFFTKRIERDIQRMFAFRHQRTRWDLERHATAQLSPQIIALTGASGFIGAALVPFLTTGGHSVRTIGRGQADSTWNPSTNTLDADAFTDVDTVIHLAGENVAQRWRPATKDRIRSSRINSTALIANTLAQLTTPPRTLIIASGIGYYGTRNDDRLLDESAAAGDDFLAGVCREWESAAEPARQAGIRVVHLRIGMVVAGGGGALQKMLPAFRLGAGGRIGSGQQWQSWIHRDDLIDICHRAMYDKNLSGAINAVAPEAIRQIDFARALGHAVQRPTIAPLPAWVVRLLFGEMGQNLLLQGVRVAPGRLQAADHRWRYPTLAEALTYEV